MSAFEKKITSIYGQKGRAWLDGLSTNIQRMAALWDLNDLKPYENLSYNYVLSGYQKTTPVVLKLSLDTPGLNQEAEALQAFAGHGAVSLLAKEEGVLLLQRASPGQSLKTSSCDPGQKAIAIACSTMKRLHQAPLPRQHTFPHIKECLAYLDQEWDIPKSHLHKARTLKNVLLNTSNEEVLLHGDLHRDNILSHGAEWLVIDPKGLIGYPINEVWAFVEEPSKDLAYISHFFHFNFGDVVKWYYVHLLLAACWQVEDGLDPEKFLRLASAVRYLL